MEKKNVVANNATVNCNNCEVNVYLGLDTKSFKLNADDTCKVYHKHVGNTMSHSDLKESVSARIREALKGDDEALKYIESVIMPDIRMGGYIDVDGIVRRWVPSQCLNMVYSSKGFHAELKKRGYQYSWKVVLRDLKAQMKAWKAGDMEELEDRNRWYNQKVVLEMATDMYNELVDTINNAPRHKCKGEKYVNIRFRGLNGQRGIFEKELERFLKMFKDDISVIALARDPRELYVAVETLVQRIKNISNWEPKKQSQAFMNAYKAAGAYYTMKDLILFEDCKMVLYDVHYMVRNMCTDQESSLDELERRAEKIVGEDVSIMGYAMLSCLQDFLAHNKFDYAAVKREWAKMYELRK